MLGGTGGAATGAAGTVSTGGAGGGAGAAGTGGASGAGAAGIGGTAGRGAATGSGGSTATGGAAGVGGASGVGGTLGRGGAIGTGGVAGATGRGGATPTGGAAARGGDSGTGGMNGTAGAAGAVAPVTVWIAGDSTVMTYPEPNTSGNDMKSIYGWGQEIGQYLSSKVTISNQAIGGRSVAFFMWAVKTDSAGTYQCDSQGAPLFQTSNGNKVDTSQWARIKSGMKAGDFLLIQFGTNDETHTCPRYVSLPDFQADLGVMADAARTKGATPIFVTPMGHRSFSGSTVTNTLLPYANAMKTEAGIEMVEVEDLNLRSEEYYMSVGSSYLATNIFDGGTTHFIEAGAVKMAELIIGEIRKNNGRLAAYVK
jgi:hypothetical protein